MKFLKLLFLLSLTILSTDLVAQSGTLDPTFDGDGIVTTSISTTPSIDAGNAAVVQADGKIVVVGDSNNRFVVVRYNTDGSFDTTFNSYGVIFPFNGVIAYAVTLQSDGKIVAAGRSNSGLYLVRLNTNGTLDTTLDTDGKVTVPNFNGSIYVKSIAVATDGKILVAGYTGSASNRDFAVFRFNIDGSLDTTFDTDGILTTDFGSAVDLGSAMVIQPDGRIIVAGPATIAGNYDFALARYNTDGSLDTSFGGSGKVTTTIGTGSDVIRAIDLQVDGKIVVSGYTVNATINYIAAARYNTNGSLDTSFDSDGKATFIAGISTGIKVLADGKMLINSTANADFSVAKLNTSGSLDTSFGTSGYTTYNIGADASNFMCVKADGIIMVGGTSDGRISTLQFSTTGSFVSFFLNPAISFRYNAIVKVLIQPDGKTLAVGTTDDDRIVLVRYNDDGSFDNGFGANGILMTNQPSGNSFDVELIIQNDTKIVVTTSSGFMYRYLSDGITDTTFGINGVADLSATITYLDNAILANDGKFYLAIDYEFNAESQLALLRINSNGSIDTNFGINGIGYTRSTFYASDDVEYARELVELPNGKLLISGWISDSTSANTVIGIIQLNSDGTLDNSFGTNGKVFTNIGARNYPNDLVLQQDNKFIISATIDGVYYTIRYNSSGAIDTTYGTNGIVTDLILADNSLLQSDGKLLKSGIYNNHFAISRYNVDGSTDTTFGTSGIINTSIGASSDINHIALNLDNKLVAVGNTFNGYNEVFAVARYTDLNLGNLDFAASNKSMFIYPNPIEEETNLTYKLTTATSVSIELFDMQGKLLKTYLQNASQNPDAYNQKIVFPTGLQSGNYLLKISSPDGSNMIKLMKK